MPWPTITLSLIAVGLVILALGGYLTPLSRLTLSPVIAVQTWVSERFQAVQFYLSAPRDVAQLTRENESLTAEVAHLQTQIIELQQQLGEFRILSALLDFARAYPEYQYVGASVIGRDPSPFVKYIHINRGSDDGLRRGMPVVTQQGLVGRISQVTASAALVQLITDPSVTVNVRLEPTRAEAILSGSITGDIGLDLIPQAVTIEPGELVLTSGLGGNYPPNILIGQITGVRSQDYDLFQSASMQPVVDFSNLEIVLVITNFQPVDLSPLIPTPGTP
ncbi:MAG: rod shape-determining protein MreC [Anaerolineae bacterium]|nr:rod shape-determining protein MreC [Anaerolineae bacterium]MBL6965700.1 rod shape-determining protein MreC [Anaerolineales bacterium]